MHAAEVVIRKVQRDCRVQVLNLLTEGVRQSRESAEVHLQRQILPLDEARGDVLVVGLSENRCAFRRDHLRRAIPTRPNGFSFV